MSRLLSNPAIAALHAQKGQESIELFKHGSLRVKLYKPNGIDHQKPHTQDEIYVVISGKGFFVKGGERKPFEPGEVLFAPAGEEHRFESFREDFATWVFFYGPEGGEKAV
jgi:mannose-6-phosphate isomerase-like protein (cupin superfamily)